MVRRSRPRWANLRDPRGSRDEAVGEDLGGRREAQPAQCPSKSRRIAGSAASLSPVNADRAIAKLTAVHVRAPDTGPTAIAVAPAAHVTQGTPAPPDRPQLHRAHHDVQGDPVGCATAARP